MKDRDREADMRKLAAAFFDNLERERHCEYGGWGLNDKRPFGNSQVESDILEIIGLEFDAGTDTWDQYHSEEAKEYARDLYEGLGAWLKARAPAWLALA